MEDPPPLGPLAARPQPVSAQAALTGTRSSQWRAHTCAPLPLLPPCTHTL